MQFYDERLPDNITTASRLRGWLKRHPEAEPGLRLSREQLLVRAVDEEMGNQFPDHLEWEDFSLALSYHFEPGHPEDGVSVTIPVGLFEPGAALTASSGWCRVCCARSASPWLRDCPRRCASSWCRCPTMWNRALVTLEPADQPLTEALAAQLRAASGVRIAADDWDSASLDDYYRMNFRIVDAEGKLLRQGRELDSLIDASREQTRESLENTDDEAPLASGLTRWELDDLPEHWRSKQAGIEIESYPALEDRGDSVAVTLHDYPGQAAVGHRRGLTRLYQLQCSQQVRYLRKNLLRGNAANLLLAGAGLARDSLLDDLLDAVFARAFLDGDVLPRSEQAFQAGLQSGRGEIITIGNDYERVLLATFESLVEVRRRLAGLTDSALAYVREDIERQLEGLLGAGFLYRTPWGRIGHYPRYMKALQTRLERLAAQPGKDQGHTATVAELEAPLFDYLGAAPEGLALNPELLEYRWMLEELRVSFFAQSLGTAQPVSAKRLLEQWSRVQEWQRANPH